MKKMLVLLVCFGFMSFSLFASGKGKSFVPAKPEKKPYSNRYLTIASSKKLFDGPPLSRMEFDAPTDLEKEFKAFKSASSLHEYVSGKLGRKINANDYWKCWNPTCKLYHNKLKPRAPSICNHCGFAMLNHLNAKNPSRDNRPQLSVPCASLAHDTYAPLPTSSNPGIFSNPKTGTPPSTPTGQEPSQACLDQMDLYRRAPSPGSSELSTSTSDSFELIPSAPTIGQRSSFQPLSSSEITRGITPTGQETQPKYPDRNISKDAITPSPVSSESSFESFL